jgi:hypothetical protein
MSVLKVYDSVAEQWIIAAVGAKGDKGDTGDTGDTGPTGPGVASGGTTNQALLKNSNTNFDTKWSTLTAADVGADATGTASSAVSSHAAVTTSVHGIADTASLVVGPASATSGRVAVYDGTTGKLLQDGTKAEADLVVGPASAVADTVALFDGTTGKVLKAGGKMFLTVEHGSDGSEPRPSFAATVYWKGTVAPVNGANGDLWYDTTGLT